VSSVPRLLTRAVLPQAELSAARLDGELFAVDVSWVCADEPDRAEVRADALGALLPRSEASARLVMMGLTAAWLHGVTDAAPWRHEVCSRSEERASLWLPPRFVLRELCVAEGDECLIGGLRVTTPVRTAFDLGRRESPDDADLTALRALVRRYRITPADAAGGSRASLPGAQRSFDRIATCAAQPPLTR
jgi:hypothetical protein